ncbi:MAG: tRNA uridine-5-carboxymethylaminomethyl(34) synthesis GTPase MnmE [Desulfobacterales bacterium]|nr:tRNA uridine-5-carboxymethylaminomethyl(34) synthesis GTPase MnmE [Desulfobacterales bacterium]
MTDTIAAIATPYGQGGIGVIRISGPEALDIAAQIFSRTRNPVPGILTPLKSHRVYHGYILDTDRVVDEVMVIPMMAPRSYTAEDVVEIQAHSGTVVLRQILDLILDRGARLSDPGEFTKRAFLNHRIDLTQAEAVCDIINAKSESALKFAASQNLGALQTEILSLQEPLTRLLAQLEVSIDFPDDVDAPALNQAAAESVQDVLTRCSRLIAQHNDACFLKDGIRIAICGQPNVGKSSLMNRILTREKSIVTDIPGTTRDAIEESMNLEGIPLVLVDTAGIHDTDDLVEIIGIERAKDQIRDADLILFMKAAETPFSMKEFTKTVPSDKRVIIVLNKMDLIWEEAGTNPSPDVPARPPRELANQVPVVEISALTDAGIDTLRERIVSTCIQDLEMDGSAVIPNLRHKKALEQTQTYLEALLTGIAEGQEEETLAIEVKNSLDALGTITGETASIDILDTIFSNFCIGK